MIYLYIKKSITKLDQIGDAVVKENDWSKMYVNIYNQIESNSSATLMLPNNESLSVDEVSLNKSHMVHLF